MDSENQTQLPTPKKIKLEKEQIIALPKGGNSSILYCEKLPAEICMPKDVFEEIVRQCPKERNRVVVFGKEFYPERRFESFGRDYNFSGEGHAPPDDKSLHPFIEKLRQWVDSHSGKTYQQTLVNWYLDGKAGIGKHSDDEKQLVPNSDIYSFSFGATRRFIVTHKEGVKIYKKEFELTNNSLLVMRGEMQKHFKHEVPKEESKIVGPRINVTFRLFKQ
jgi:alkylated DNA repair dioxygenase AlkB